MGWLEDLMREVDPDRLFASDEEKARQDGEYAAEREAASQRRARELEAEAESDASGPTGHAHPAHADHHTPLLLGGLLGFAFAIMLVVIIAITIFQAG